MQSSQRPGNETTVVDESRQKELRCGEVCSEKATAVCGRCGLPLCEEEPHQNEHRIIWTGQPQTDPLFGDFVNTFGKLLLAFGLLVVIPLAWSMSDPVMILEEGVLADQDDITIPNDLGTTVLHSSILLGVALSMTLWVQSADRITSVRVRQRAPRERVFCNDCSADVQVPRLILHILTALGLLLVVLGAYLAWSNSGVASLRLSAVGIVLLSVKSELVMLVGKLIE